MALILHDNCGFVATAPTVDPADVALAADGNACAIKDTAPGTAVQITKVGWHCKSNSQEANWEIALFSDDATGEPHQIGSVTRTNAKGTALGFLEADVFWEITPGVVYWLALQVADTAITSNIDSASSGGAGSARKSGVATLPADWGASTATDSDGMVGIFAVWSATVTVPPVDTFIIAGQSNVVGSFTERAHAYYTHDASLVPTVFRALRPGDGWLTLVDHTNDIPYAHAGSVWPLLSTHHMHDRGVPTRFLTGGVGGTGLVAGVAGADIAWAVGGSAYLALIAAVAAAGLTEADAILWFQGEAEVSGGVEADLEDRYFDAMVAMHDGLETAFGFTVPIIVGQTGNMYDVSSPKLDAIRRAQARLWEESGFHAGPVTCDIDHSGPDALDVVHFTTTAQAKILAYRWWHHTNVALFGGTGGRGPRFASVDWSGTLVDIAFTVANGELTAGASPTVGWRADDAGAAITVTAAAVSRAVVQLTLSRAPVAPWTLTWGSINDASGATIQDALHLPPEPFEEVVT